MRSAGHHAACPAPPAEAPVGGWQRRASPSFFMPSALAKHGTETSGGGVPFGSASRSCHSEDFSRRPHDGRPVRPSACRARRVRLTLGSTRRPSAALFIGLPFAGDRSSPGRAQVADPLDRLGRDLHGHARRQHRQHLAAEHPDRLRGRHLRRRVDRGGLPADRGEPAPAVRPARRGPHLQAGLPLRVRALHGGQRPLRGRADGGGARWLPGPPGDRGGDAPGDGARDHHPHVRGEGARPSPRAQRDQRVDRAHPRAGARRPPDRVRNVAGDLPRQRTRRPVRDPVGSADPARRAARPAAAVRRPGRGALLSGHAGAPARPHRGPDLGLGEPGGRRTDRRVRRPGGLRSWPRNDALHTR